MKLQKMSIVLFALCLFGALFCVNGFASEDGKINLNEATVAQLVEIPGVSETIAKGIVELREENEEFVDLEELLDVDGLDNQLLRTLSRYLYVEQTAGCNC
ncbi:helix-hairpin-helix domain-containing protein [Desulfoluna sp.]|uniref:ComEA family DNA-binding protein n=1 Tax=Desulfoluna sp. TaxID=2045199 RepID=UPI00260905C0|nr:helix-hairpin-helix domain-containing protein [Desulfoluna sp.]